MNIYKIYQMEEIKQFYENHENNLKSPETFVINNYMPMKRLLTIAVNTPGFKNRPADYLKIIEDNDDWRTASSKQFYTRALLFFLSEYLKVKNLQLVIDKLQSYKVEVKMNPNTVQYIPYQDIETAVLKKFGSTSMEFLFIKLFYEQPGRLDYYGIEIDNDKTDKNYDTNTGVLTMKSFTKTVRKYGTKEITLSPELQELIRASLLTNPRQFLIQLNNANLSRAIIYILKKSGFKDASMNTLRYSLSARPGMTADERVELAHRMGHAATTNVEYMKKTVT